MKKNCVVSKVREEQMLCRNNGDKHLAVPGEGNRPLCSLGLKLLVPLTSRSESENEEQHMEMSSCSILIKIQV